VEDFQNNSHEEITSILRKYRKNYKVVMRPVNIPILLDSVKELGPSY
jgi:hypothetical protein